MSKRKCDICDGYLPDYADGKLDEDTRERMREHLASSPACAHSARELQALFSRVLSRDEAMPPLPDRGAFLAAVNTGIDRRAARRLSTRFEFHRPAVYLPALTAAVFLIIAGLYLFTGSDQRTAETDLFPGLPTQAEVLRMNEDGSLTPLSIDLLLPDLSIGGATAVAYQSSVDDAAVLEDAIDATLLARIPYAAVISASLDYLSPDEVLETLSADLSHEIVTDLEKQPFTLL
jgi:anti-sigma factor RsiW